MVEGTFQQEFLILATNVLNFSFCSWSKNVYLFGGVFLHHLSLNQAELNI